MTQKQLLTYDQAKQTRQQHTSPCSDCPWARKNLKGWLGSTTVWEWLWAAHHEGRMECHTKKQPNGEAWQCAGGATYRANIAKRVEPPNLKLARNLIKVFSSPIEFATHHLKRAVTTEEIGRRFQEVLRKLFSTKGTETGRSKSGANDESV